MVVIEKGDELVELCEKLIRFALKTKNVIAKSKLAAAMMILSGIRAGPLLTGKIVVKPGSTSHSIVFKKHANAPSTPETPLLCEASLFVQAAAELKRMQNGVTMTTTQADDAYKNVIGQHLSKMCSVSPKTHRLTSGDARWIFVALCYRKHNYAQLGVRLQEFVDWVSRAGTRHAKIPTDRIVAKDSDALANFSEAAQTPLPKPLAAKVAKRMWKV